MGNSIEANGYNPYDYVLTTIAGLAAGAGLMGAAMLHYVPDGPTMIDCSDGSRSAATTLILPEGKKLSMQPISGDKNISFKADPDGGVTMYVSNQSVQEHLPTGETLTAKELNLKPGSSVTFESKGANYEVKGSLSDNKQVEIQINASCK